MALEKTVMAFQPADGEPVVVTITSADRINSHRAMKAAGINASTISMLEYEHRLAFTAGQRVGFIPSEVEFDEWLLTVEAFDSEFEDAEGEAGATPSE